MRYEVQQKTEYEGWVNTFYDDEGLYESFPTFEEAQKAIDDFFNDSEKPETYTREEFRVVELLSIPTLSRSAVSYIAHYLRQYQRPTPDVILEAIYFYNESLK